MLPPSNIGRSPVEPTRRASAVRAEFEVFDVTIGRDAGLAARLAKGMFATPGVYPAVVRFGNSDPKTNSDFKARHPIVSFLGRSHSGGRGCIRGAHWPTGLLYAKRDDPADKRLARNARELMKLLAASNPLAGLLSLPFRDKLRVLRTLDVGHNCRHTRRSNLTSNCVIGATCRFVMDRPRW